MVNVPASEPIMDERSYAWPFAVSRNAWLDWRPCVAPAHMIAQGGEYFLVHAADPGDRPCPSPVFERVVSTERYGDLTVLARCLPATADLIGGSTQEQLRDRAGRPIQIIEGLILPGRQPGSAAHWQAQLVQAHEIAQRAFPEFWRSEDETAPPAPSQPLSRQSADGQTAAGQTVSGQTAARQTVSGQTAAGQTVSGQTAAGQTAAGQTAAGQTVSGQTAAGQTVSGQTADERTTDERTTDVRTTDVRTTDVRTTDSEPGSTDSIGQQGRRRPSARRVIVSAVCLVVGAALIYIIIRAARR